MTRQAPVLAYRVLIEALMASVAIAGCAMLVAAPLFTELSQALAVPLSRFGLLPAFHGAALAVCAPIVGLTAQRQPRTTLMVSGLLIYGGAWLLAASVTSFPVLLFSAVLMGIGSGLVLPPAYALAGDLAATGAGAAATRRVVGGWSIAFLAVMPFSALAQWAGWRTAFVTLGLLSIAVALVIMRAPKPQPLLPAAASETRVWPSLAAVLGHSAARRLLIANMINMGGYFAIYTFLGSELRRANDWGPSAAGVVLSIYGLGLTLISLNAHRVLELGARRAGRTCLLLLAPILIALPLSVSWPWAAMGLIALWAFIQGTVFTSTTVLANEVLPPYRGVIAALQGAGTYLGVMIFTTVAAAVYSTAGFAVVGLACAISTVIASLVLGRGTADAPSSSSELRRE